MTEFDYAVQYNQGYSWEQDYNDPMIIVIRYMGQPVMRFFLGEAMEGAGRKRIMAHVAECDRSPWITSWHNGHPSDIVDILTK